MRRCFSTLIVLFAFSSVMAAQSGFRLKARSAADLYAEQRRIVGTWCRQDFEGLRLNSALWDRFKPLTNIKSDPDFTSIIVVSRFQVEPRDSMSWEMAVTYTIIGRYEKGGGYVPDPGSQTVTFQTKDFDGDILITGIDPGAPHVSKKAAVEWMKKELSTTTSDIDKIHLQDALKLLDSAPVANASPSSK